MEREENHEYKVVRNIESGPICVINKEDKSGRSKAMRRIVGPDRDLRLSSGYTIERED